LRLAADRRPEVGAPRNATVIGVVSDVHGNLPALEAVLADMPDVEQLVCAGDVVGYNPWHADCVELLREREALTVMGNHDRAVASGSTSGFNGMARAGVEHAREQLSPDAVGWLAGLPDERRLGDLAVVHGHPEAPDRYTYPESFSPSLLGEERVLVLGHTHVQGHRVFDEGVVLNPGSVGQPRDGDPRAAYALLESTDGEYSVSERRVEYDVDRVIEAVAETGLPERVGTRLREGR
jgi:putative phosphoesterase